MVPNSDHNGFVSAYNKAVENETDEEQDDMFKFSGLRKSKRTQKAKDEVGRETTTGAVKRVRRGSGKVKEIQSSQEDISVKRRPGRPKRSVTPRKPSSRTFSRLPHDKTTRPFASVDETDDEETAKLRQNTKDQLDFSYDSDTGSEPDILGPIDDGEARFSNNLSAMEHDMSNVTEQTQDVSIESMMRGEVEEVLEEEVEGVEGCFALDEEEEDGPRDHFEIYPFLSHKLKAQAEIIRAQDERMKLQDERIQAQEERLEAQNIELKELKAMLEQCIKEQKKTKRGEEMKKQYQYGLRERTKQFVHRPIAGR
jgi:hypothetical protein